ncbi:hypothetical protein [Helicobacter zhangjianzhongii]|nr:hypothetical protein [Helicobacter sp. CPD2-1]MDL0079881.1 hypothetical protein [Helicobacter sp. CPD2-1]
MDCHADFQSARNDRKNTFSLESTFSKRSYALRFLCFCLYFSKVDSRL